MRTPASSLSLLRPQTLHEALVMLRDEASVTPIAGCTDVYVGLQFGTLPARRFGAEWVHEICTYEPALEPAGQRWPSRGEVVVHARSMKLLRRA